MMERRVFCFGEVLWDKFPLGKVPGGAPLNVAFHARNLGLNSILYSAVGSDEDGKDLLNFIGNVGLDASHVKEVVGCRTGAVQVNLANPKEVTYTIEGPSAWDFLEIDVDVVNSITDKDIIVFGSLSSRSAVNQNTLSAFLSSPALKVMDLNLRPPFFSKELITSLLMSTDLLKVNREEYNQLVTWFNINPNPSKGFWDLLQQFNISILVVTSGSQGSRYLTKSGDVLSKTFQINCVDTVGAGDSFLAALIYGLVNEYDAQEMVDFASGLGALVAGKAGATPKFTRQEIEEFINPLVK